MRQLKIKIDSLAFGASGVGREPGGKVCFVEDALPGEEVVFDVAKETSRYIRGALSEVVTASPDRVRPVCRYYGTCGACQLQHVSYEKELFYKKEQVDQLIRRIAGVKDFSSREIVPSKEAYHYRSSVTLARNSKGEYGYYARDGRTVIGIEECPIAEKGIEKELARIKDTVSGERVTLKSDREGRVWGTGRSGEKFFTDRFGDIELVLSPRAFSQCNRHIAAGIADTLGEWIGRAGDDTALFDVYCGTGLFSFLITRDFSLRLGIDEDRSSIDSAKTTVEKRGLKNIKFYKGSAEREFPRLFEANKRARNIVILDPPRQGMDKKFLEEIKKATGIGILYYLSCDPSRLARDIKIMTDGGAWGLGRVQPFDMFPRTKHIEVLAEFISK